MMLLSLAFSAGLLLIVSLATLGGSRPSYLGAVLLSMAAAACVFLSGSAIFLCNALLVGIVAITCQVTAARRRTFVASSLLATAVVYVGAIIFFVIPEQREWANLKENYPVESLAERLQYEKVARNFTPPDNTLALGNSAALGSFEKRMGEAEFGVFRREVSLSQLHAGSVDRFINSQGFGVGRMPIRPTPKNVELPEPQPISLPVYPDDPAETPSSGDPRSRESSRSQRSPQDLHEESLLSFLNPLGFGYVKDRDHVVGFQPHAFAHAPRVTTKWWIDRLELVSLLKHEEPAVYLSDHLPRMQDLRDAETRPLDEFEQGALVALRRGEDVREQSTPDRIRMFGAIRAVKQCLKCHSVERGELLGAFSYDLRREP